MSYRLTSGAFLIVLALAACGPRPATLDAAEFVQALEAAGATVEPAGPIEQEFFTVEGRLFAVNGADVQVFEYADAAAREADSSQISADGGSIGTTMVTWIDQPNFWAKDRLIVLYVGRDQALIDLLSGILGEPLTEPWPAIG
ncbi:MAG TPA: hypothetical protein VFI11_05165 [Anaerolineales bacterium]|nr:hypothetical protein [Anaerolineales bacterium]